MNSQSSMLQLQQIAKIACFSTEYQKKMQAQCYFLEMAKNLSPSMFVEALQNGSDTLIFVTIQYANKLIEQYPLDSLKEIFNAVEGEVRSWYVPDSHQFKRMLINSNTQSNQSKQLTKYVLNSISLFLSNCMKRFFIQDSFQKRSQIVSWINTNQNQKYKLWLFSIFIQNISQLDSSMGFIKFRSLSHNFQQQVIPVIAKCLVPFLYKVEDIMKVNQISLMQQHLNVEQDSGSVRMNSLKKQKVFQNSNQLKFAELIFDLLHSLVFYNFHLTYTEYQQDSTFENCLICFPEEFTSKVVNQEFINCIGYVIQRLIDLMSKSKFLKTTLQCLQKIFLTKLSYVDQQRKVNFIRECAVTLTKVLLKNNLDQDTLTRVMVCNNRFITNVQINYFKQKQPLKEAFHQWLLAITKTTFLVLDNVAFSKQFNFNLEDNLVIECLELYHKIVASLCSITYYSFQETNKIDVEEKQYIEKNVQTITRIILNKLFFDQCRPLVEGTTAQIFKSYITAIKTFCSCFFQPFKLLASLNYGFLFSQIQKSIGQASGISVKFNIFMLLAEIMDRNYLQRNIVMVKASDEQVYILSKCVNMGLNFIQIYLKNKSQYPVDQQMILMDMSILVFLDKILSEFLGHFDNHEHSIEIKHAIFRNILTIQNKGAYSPQASQEFVLFCIESVLSYLLIYNKNQECKHINDFIFDTINRILMKFKWGIKRQVFKSSQIYTRLLEFFNSVSKQANIKPIQTVGLPLNLSLFSQFQRLKWRKKLLKVIALLYFDDVIDDYRKNLETLFSAFKQQHILTILLDVEGIGSAIDTSSIYKAYLEMVQKYCSLGRITDEMVHFATSFTGYDKASKKYPKVVLIKEVVRMHGAVLSNKGQRIGNPKNMQSVYMMIKALMGYWTNFLRMSLGQEWVSVVKQIIQLITQLIKCDRINFYLVQRVCTQEYVHFFNQMFTKMLTMTSGMDQHPKLYQVFLQSMVHISRQLLGVIFFPTVTARTQALQDKNKEISQTVVHLFLVVFKRIPLFLQQIKIGSVKNQSYLQKSLQIVKFTLTFIGCRKRQAFIHRKQMQHINLFVEEMKQLIFTQLRQIMACLTSEKHFSVHRRTLIIILYQATIIYPGMMAVLIETMTLPNYLLNELKQCLQCIEKQELQLFVDRFKTWLRMLHMSQEQVKKNKQQFTYGFMAII